MIAKSFKVAGISLVLDGSEDHLFRNKDILQKADQQEDEKEGYEEGEEDPFSSDNDSEDDSEGDD